MSWYTIIYDAIGPTPGPGPIEAKEQRVLMLASFRALKGGFCRPAYCPCHLLACPFQVLAEYSNSNPGA
jgi:hypothetical protein